MFGAVLLSVTLLSSNVMAAASVVRSGDDSHVFISGDTAREIQSVLSRQTLFDLSELFSSREISGLQMGNSARIFLHGKDLGSLVDANDPKLLTMGRSAFGVTQEGNVVITGYLANILVDENMSNLVRCARVQTGNFPGFPAISHNRCELE